jgi:biopolymer transport protein ExbB
MTKFLALAAFTAFLTPLLAQENYAQWTGQRSYYLNTTASGANVPGTVRNFPVLIRLSVADSAIFTAAKAAGADLRFTKPNGTRLQHQIESWSATAKTAAIWVRVDTVRGNTANQVLRMHWGKSDAADSSRGAAVFDTANGFVAVWHMTGAGNAEFSSTANQLDAVPGSAVPGSAAGNIGSGRTFDGSTQYFTVNDNPRLNFTEQITISLWVNATNWNGSTRLIQKSAAGDNNSGQYGLRDDSNNMLALNLNGVHTANGAAPSPAVGEWHLVHVTFDGSATAQYQDGALVASGSNSAPIATSNGDLNIARRPDGTSFFTGTMDEVRINKVARSADWAKLEYENQKAGQTLMTLNPVGVRFSGSTGARGESFAVASSAAGVTFTLPAGSGRALLTVSDMRGKVLWSRKANLGSRLTWSGRGLPAGAYTARATLLEGIQKGLSFQRNFVLAR